jgi:aspartate aminotransferase-like enzyme
MGHMGNISVSQVYFALQALEKTLSSLGYKFEPGSGVKAAELILEE